MLSIIMINTWRGLPFYGITLLAGLQTVPPELYEAATIDGASGWQRFRYVTLPLLQPIILIVTLFSVIFTFADFQLVYVLTHGGPQNATQLFATYAFDIGMGAGQLGLGASVALAMNQQFPLKNLVRALMLLPFIVPTVLSTVAWMWILDPAFSVLNWLLVAAGVPKPGPSWLGNPILAMLSIIMINTWRGLPFYGITLLAGQGDAVKRSEEHTSELQSPT